MPTLADARHALLSAKRGRDLHIKGAAFLRLWLAERYADRLVVRPATASPADFCIASGGLELPVWAPCRAERKEQDRHPLFDVNRDAFRGSPDGIVLAVWIDRASLHRESGWVREAWGFLYRRDAWILPPGHDSFRQPVHRDAERWALHRCDSPYLLGEKVFELLRRAKVPR